MVFLTHILINKKAVSLSGAHSFSTETQYTEQVCALQTKRSSIMSATNHLENPSHTTETNKNKHSLLNGHGHTVQKNSFEIKLFSNTKNIKTHINQKKTFQTTLTFLSVFPSLKVVRDELL